VRSRCGWRGGSSGLTPGRTCCPAPLDPQLAGLAAAAGLAPQPQRPAGQLQCLVEIESSRGGCVTWQDMWC